jgi:hypothetical protein
MISLTEFKKKLSARGAILRRAGIIECEFLDEVPLQEDWEKKLGMY